MNRVPESEPSEITPSQDEHVSKNGRAHFLQVFLSQRPQMEALVSRRVGCRATAADLVQDLFVRFWRRPLVQVEELSTYLLRCAGNIAIDHLRSEGARMRVSESLVSEQQDIQGSEPQAALEAGNDCAMSRRPCVTCRRRPGRFSFSTASMVASTRKSPRPWGFPKVLWKNI